MAERSTCLNSRRTEHNLRTMTTQADRTLPVALSIAGSDSGGGAGIQADLLSFAANGAFGTTVLTCLTAQNPGGVDAVEAARPETVAAQLRQIALYFDVAALKTGMLLNADIVRVVAGFLRNHPEIPVVADPVMVASSGAKLLDDPAVDAIRDALLPRATLITPNLDEAAVLLGKRPDTIDAMRGAARELCAQYGAAVLLKGGHLEGDAIVDVLHTADGGAHEFHATRRADVDTHGSGCTLSAAITAHLAHGEALPDAVAKAHAYLQRGIANGLRLKDRVFIAHNV